MAKTESPLVMEKSRLRQVFRQKWDMMVDKEKKTQELTEHLVAFLKTQPPLAVWSGYQALDSEISIHEVARRCGHLRWVYPVMDGDNLRFYEPGVHGFAKGSFGILEPARPSRQEVLSQALDGVLVPGLGFDRDGCRLGKGKGHYDRALSQAGMAVKVGVSFSDLVVGKLPTGDWDVSMDRLATETGVIGVKAPSEG